MIYLLKNILDLLGGVVIYQVLLNLCTLKALLKCISVITITTIKYDDSTNNNNIRHQIWRLYQNILVFTSKALSREEK